MAKVTKKPKRLTKIKMVIKVTLTRMTTIRARPLDSALHLSDKSLQKQVEVKKERKRPLPSESDTGSHMGRIRMEIRE